MTINILGIDILITLKEVIIFFVISLIGYILLVSRMAKKNSDENIIFLVVDSVKEYFCLFLVSK